MTLRRRGPWALATVLLLVRPASADTEAVCTSGDCEYRFDDGDVNAPGQSAYGEWLKVRPPAKRVLLIRPRISFVMEIWKSGDGV